MIPETTKHSIFDIPLTRWFPANLESVLVVLILLGAIVSRFYNLGAMTITFDETNHTVPSYSLYSGNGYQYDPLSHGPLQFHMLALSYALFGDTDFATRIPAALLSVASIALVMLAFRRYLGRTGAILAGVLFLISPYMLFYGRYARNEAYIVVWGLLSLYAILRYLERGETWILFLFTAVNAIHFTDKTTSFMYAGEEFIFLVAYFVDRMARRNLPEAKRRRFLFLGLACVLLLAAAAGLYLTQKPLDSLAIKIALGVLAAAVIAALVWSGVEVVDTFGWAELRSQRSLQMAILLVTFVLPQVAAVPLMLLKYTPADYTSGGLFHSGPAVAILAALAIVIGLGWFGRKWLLHAAVFFVPFVLLYSTFFTNPVGIMGGLVGVLSYWITASGTNRVYQPYFYYLFIEIPMYEFLPALGTLVAIGIATIRKLWQSLPGQPFTPAGPETGSVSDMPPEAASPISSPLPLHPVPFAALLVYWTVSSLIIFSIAGEKAPWLTVHITLPMILAAAWAFGWMIETIPWGRLATWDARNYVRLTGLAFFALLALVTGRAAFRAAYINYDYPLEYLVYAHHSPYPKVILNDIEQLSIRTSGAMDMVVAYDDNVRYPYWWYMRSFPNKIDYAANPTSAVKNAPVIVASDDTNAKLTPVVRENYAVFKFPRIWWQNMDYWNLDWKTIDSERNADLASQSSTAAVPPMTVSEYLSYVWGHIRPFFTDARVRNAVWQIWFNRDYTAWAVLKGSDSYSLTNWGGAQYMYEYVRKDISSLLWPYGASPKPLLQTTDPYTSLTTPVTPDALLGSAGSQSGQFQAPRQIALAADGSLYVADSLNDRIQHLRPDGTVLQVWGTRADIGQGAAPGGTFNEPWGVAVAPDGSVYVSDTWNYRIQKFSADGKFLLMWGTGPAEGKDQFYGPRGLAVDSQGRVLIADTGNKRIVIYDSSGVYLGEFGMPGMQLGQLDEPVDLALDAAGNVYVTDTWNQRVQVFTADASGLFYQATAEWPVAGWYGNGLENKPFITVDASGTVSVTDPELCRVISFSAATGKPLHVWDGCAAGAFQQPSGIVSDGEGGLWVTDVASGKLVHFKTQNP